MSYTMLKSKVEGKKIDETSLDDIYETIYYLSHRLKDEKEEDQWWTRHQLYIAYNRQRKLLADKGIYVLKG